MPSNANYQRHDYPGGDAPFRVAETFGPVPYAHNYMDSLRMNWRRTPEAQYPDGYLGTIPSRRGDRLMDGLKARSQNRPYTRGVHKGERVDTRDYFWPDEFNLWTGIAYEMQGSRFSPPGLSLNDGMLEAERYPTDHKVGPRSVAQGARYAKTGGGITPNIPNPDRLSTLRELRLRVGALEGRIPVWLSRIQGGSAVMKKKGEQFHPSRDKRPAEYSIEGEGIRIPGEGLYEDADEIHRATEYWKEEGVADHPLFRPLQGRLFDAEEHEADQRLALGRKRFVPTGDAADEGRAAGVRDRAMLHSRIPTSHLQERRSSSGGAKPETLFDITNEGAGWTGAPYGGYYRGPALNTRSDLISAKPGPGEVNTFVHEQGHRRHLGELPAWADTATHPRGRYPDPLKEGIADGYADRYGGPDDLQVHQMKLDIEDGRGKFGSAYQTTGYSTNENAAEQRGWDDTDRALYAATRAHASETGEEPAYQTFGRNNMEESGMAVGGGSVDPTVDATLHHLLSTSPHAVQALRQTGLKGVGAESFQRHEDRMLMNQGQEVQGALFHEMTGHTSGKVHGYEPDADIIYGNMMAETPRLPLRERAAKLGEHMDAMDERHAALEAEHGELVFPQSMSHNQFGKKPRTESDVNQTLGVSAKNAAKRGFPARS